MASPGRSPVRSCTFSRVGHIGGTDQRRLPVKGITLRPRDRPARDPGRSRPSGQLPCSSSRRAPRHTSCHCPESDAAPDACSTRPCLGPPGPGATSGCSSGREPGRTPRSGTTTRTTKVSAAAALTTAARCRPWVNASRATSSRAAPTRSGSWPATAPTPAQGVHRRQGQREADRPGQQQRGRHGPEDEPGGGRQRPQPRLQGDSPRTSCRYWAV
jgi:hypothetical protein